MSANDASYRARQMSRPRNSGYGYTGYGSTQTQTINKMSTIGNRETSEDLWWQIQRKKAPDVVGNVRPDVKSLPKLPRPRGSGGSGPVFQE